MTDNNKKIIKAGETIIKQGDEGSTAYILEQGKVEIFIEKDNGLIQSLGTRGAGTLIGEMAIVDNQPRTATVKAREDCSLLEITREDFERRVENADPVLKMVMQVILTRYRDTLARAHILGKDNNLNTLEKIERNAVQENNAIYKIKLNNDLKKALDNQVLQLYYQPIINLQTGELSGFEALMRWIDDEKGFSPPDEFIPVAEDSGLIIELSRWAVTEACKTLQTISKRFEFPLLPFMSVNFSAIDFMTKGFKKHLYSTLERFNLPPEALHIEITERLLMEHPDQAEESLRACRDAGMIISIDDFGTGYSSLSYLHYFPIDILKIDRSFINNMMKDDSAMELVKSIIALGHNMNMSIIAEGIEEAEQAERLKNMKCDKVQGYHFARPMPMEELISYIEKSQKS